MMWNYLVSGLAVDATIVLYDGSPAHPDLSALWRMADEERVTYFGTSAPFLMACRKDGLRPGDAADLSRLRGIGSTGSPLPVDGFRYVYDAISPTVHLQSVSGGTDVCTAFVGASPLVPVWEGELSCRHLGCGVEAYSPDGRPLVGEQGELVLTAPMPSMPVSFWNDPTGERYRAAYFDDFPGRLAPRGLGHVHRTRILRDQRPLGRDAESRRGANRDGRVLRGGGVDPGGAGLPGRSPRRRGGSPAAVRCPGSRRASRRRAANANHRASCARRSRRAMCPTRSWPSRAFRARCPERSSRCP